MGDSLLGLARGCSRRPGRVLALWMAAIGVAVVVAVVLLGRGLSQEIHLTTVTESERAARLLAEGLRPAADTELFLVSSPTSTVDDPAFRDLVERLQAGLQGLGPDVVVAAVTYYQTDDPSMVSADRRATIVPTVVAGKVSEATEKVPALRRVAAETQAAGFAVQLVGDAAAAEEVGRLAQDDIARGGLIGFVVALVLLLVALGGVVALGMPVAVNLAITLVALGLVALVGQLARFSALAALAVAVFGLAVAVNQSLFVVARYRQERARGLDPVAAAGEAGATAARVAAYGGVAVVLALAGLLLVPSNVVRSVAGGVMLVVAVGTVAAATLVPALLAKMGDRVDGLPVRPGLASGDGAVAGGVARAVVGLPSVFLVLGLALLLACASQWGDLRPGTPSPLTLPPTSDSARAIGALAAAFPTLVKPVEVVVAGAPGDPAVTAGVDRLVATLGGDPMFLPATVTPGDGVVLVSAPLLADPTGEPAIAAVERVRDDYVPAAFAGSPTEVAVGGATAGFADAAEVARTWLPIVAVLAMVATFAVLVLALRSLVLPLVAVAANVLTAGAAFGLTALVFHEGFGTGVLGLQPAEHVYVWIPLMVYCSFVALTVDAFLRVAVGVRERHLQGAGAADAAVEGARATGGAVLAGSIVLLPLLAGIASGRGVIFQQGAFALAVGLVLDALVVRLVLVPAAVALLGRHAWYLPGWLEGLPGGAASGVTATTWTRDWSRTGRGSTLAGAGGRR